MGGMELTILLFISLFALMAMGVPLSFAMGTVAIVVGYFKWGPMSVFLFSGHLKEAIFNYTLVSVPFFMLMANILGKSGIADDLYRTMHILMGPVRGGLAMGTVLACAVIGAMSGVSAVGVMTMGTIALPAMLAHGYDRKLAMGSIMAGGALGQLIPPSVLGIVYSSVANISIGQVFLAGVLPAALLIVLFVAYIGIRCYFDVSAGPALSREERDRITWEERLRSMRSLVSPVILVASVLGVLLSGIASPTEAAALGAGASIALALFHRNLTLAGFLEACNSTLKATSMMMWIAVSSLLFVSVYVGIGGDALIRDTLLSLDMPPAAILFFMMVVIFFLGMIMDPIGIIFLTTPIFLPIATGLGYDPLLYGGLVIINLEMSYLTPPFGYNIFYLKAVTPPNITLGDIYRATPAFVLLQGLGLLLCALFPALITWLPKTVLGY